MNLKGVIVLLPFVSLVFSGVAAQTAQWPDTPAGRVASEYIKVFNSGTEQDVLKFFSDNASDAAKKRRTDDERLQAFRRMHGDLGRLTFDSILKSGESGISVLAQSENGQWVTIDFLLEPDPPHKLDGIRIERTEAPAPKVPGGGQPVLSDADLGRRLDEFITRVEAFGFAGGVLVARRGAVVLEKGYGLADRARAVPFTPKTVFDIGSNTKDFTKMAILQLAEQGKLRLDDPITKYFDNVPPDKVAITVEQVMAHTAGFGLYSGPDGEVVPRDEFLERLFKTPLVAAPGKEENYSNPGYSLLAAIIEKVTGGPYERYISERIFKPSGMDDTGYALPKWPAKRIAHSYVDDQDHGSTLDYPHAQDGPYWNLRGNGGTLSTLGDMFKFHLALEGEKLLSTASKAKLFPQDRPLSLVGGDGVHFFVYHREPAAGVAVFIASTEAGWRAMDLERAVTAIINGREVATPPQVTKAGGEALAKFAGTYTLPSGARIMVSLKKDRLAVAGDGQGAVSLLAGAGPETAETIEKFNARACSIVESSAKGDYAPIYEAFGKSMPLDEVKQQEESLWKQRKEEFGNLKGVTVVGTVLGQRPKGIKTTMSPGEARTTIKLSFERGEVFNVFNWGEEGLMGIRTLTAAPAQLFLPQSATTFASYDLASGNGTQIGFELDPSGKVKGLSVVSGEKRIIAERTE